MNTRIYVVSNRTDDSVRLVEAATAAQAIRHVATQTYHIAVARSKDVAYHMSRDLVVEVAGAEPEQLAIAGTAE